MKKIITLFAGIACYLCLTSISAFGQWTTSGADIYNSNSGNVGIGNSSPSYLLHVGKNMTAPSIRIHNMGGNGGAAFEMTDNLSGADWKFKATTLGGFKIRDHASGMDVITAEQNSSANAIYIKQGGNVGIGLSNPLEQLHVNGAVAIGNTANTTTGAIRWNGSNFEGYNGSSWVALDFNWTDPWILQPNVPVGNLEFVSGPQPMSLSFAFPGFPNPMARLYLTDMSAPGIFPHLLELESITGGPTPLDASQLFRISTGMNPPFIDYSEGIYGMDGTFKVCNGAALTLTTQSDNSTLIRAYPSGVVDFSNQSRARATIPLFDWASWQLIQPSAWTPVNFTSPIAGSPLVAGIPVWDEQAEFTVAASPSQPIVGGQPNAYFTASQDGFYQVNARVEFETDEYWDNGAGYPVYMRPNAFVSIAIYYDFQGQGTWASYSLGNNLQITNNIPLPAPPPEHPDATERMTNNNAPNVSDVIWMSQNDRISIWVFQWSYTPMNLRVGPDVIFVSVHKGS